MIPAMLTAKGDFVEVVPRETILPIFRINELKHLNAQILLV